MIPLRYAPPIIATLLVVIKVFWPAFLDADALWIVTWWHLAFAVALWLTAWTFSLGPLVTHRALRAFALLAIVIGGLALLQVAWNSTIAPWSGVEIHPLDAVLRVFGA